MVTTAVALEEVHGAIAQLRTAAGHDRDTRRAEAADWIEGLFADAEAGDRRAVRTAAAEALRLYQGGMGSFHDVGSAVMHDAVERLRHALRRAHSLFLRP